MLCRKQASSGPPAPQAPALTAETHVPAEAPQEGAGKFAALLSGLALLTMGATYVLSWDAPPKHAAASPPPMAAAAPGAPVGPDLSDLDKSKAKDLAASLDLLERPEAERHQAEDDHVQQQQLAAAHAEEQLINAALADPSADDARHEAVARESE